MILVSPEQIKRYQTWQFSNLLSLLALILSFGRYPNGQNNPSLATVDGELIDHTRAWLLPDLLN